MSMRNELLCPKTMGPLIYEQIQTLVDNNKIESYKGILERVAPTSISGGNMSLLILKYLFNLIKKPSNDGQFYIYFALP